MPGDQGSSERTSQIDLKLLAHCALIRVTVDFKKACKNIWSRDGLKRIGQGRTTTLFESFRGYPKAKKLALAGQMWPAVCCPFPEKGHFWRAYVQ